MQSKILIIGGSSILGINLALLLSARNDVTLLLHKKIIKFPGVKTYKLSNFFDPKFDCLIKQINPNILFNCAAYTNIEDCEKNPSLSKKINVELAEKIAEITNKLKIKLVHISTDHVSSGNSKFLQEGVNCNPINVYGKTKYQGEKAVLFKNSNAIVIRTNFFCWGTTYKQSFSDWIINSLRQKERIFLFKDVYFTPIYIDTIFEILEKMLRINLSGIFNLSSNERISKLDFGILIANIFNFDKDLIVTSKLSDRNDLTVRPFDMSLSNNKIKSLMNLNVDSIDHQLKLLKEKEDNKKINLIRNL